MAHAAHIHLTHGGPLMATRPDVKTQFRTAIADAVSGFCANKRIDPLLEAQLHTLVFECCDIVLDFTQQPQKAKRK